MPSNSFGYLTTIDEQRACLKCIYAHLQTGGLFVLEERYYTPDLLARMREQRGAVKQWGARINPATGRYTTYNNVVTNVDFVRQLIFSRSFIDEIQEDGSIKRYVSPENGARVMHYFSRFELQLLIEEAGFAIEALYGGNAKEPLTIRSYSMIFVARKRQRVS